MKITVLPGDGIGVEVTREAIRVLKDVAGTFDLACALIVGRRSASTDEKVSLNDALREHGIGSG